MPTVTLNPPPPKSPTRNGWQGSGSRRGSDPQDAGERSSPARVRPPPMGITPPLAKRMRGFPLMHAAGEKSACGMTVRGWAQVQAYAVRLRERHAASPTAALSNTKAPHPQA